MEKYVFLLKNKLYLDLKGKKQSAMQNNSVNSVMFFFFLRQNLGAHADIPVV